MIYLNGNSYNAAKVKVGSESRPSLQTKAATPTTEQQTVTPDSAYDGLAAVVVRAVPTETAAVTANGTYTPSAGKFFSQVSVDVPDPPNVQGYPGTGSVSATAYTATGVKLTVAKTGTYKVSWMGARNTTSGTSGSQLYIDGAAYGSAVTTFTSSYAQSVVLTDVALTAGQEVEVRARARSTSYVMLVGNLIIEQTA